MAKGDFMKLKMFAVGLALSCSLAIGQSQTQSQTQKGTQTQGRGSTPTTGQSVPAPPPTAPSAAPPPRGTVVEEIVARVNNEIITTVDLETAKRAAVDDAKQDCAAKNCTPDQLQKETSDMQRDALRNLIDEKLLVQRAKDLNLSVETDVIRQLDQIRMDHNLATLEDLEKAVAAEGENYDDFKNNIRNHLLISEVINRDVYARIGSAVDHAQMQKYYDEHKEEFQAPEMVVLREILVSTDKKDETEIPALEKKANALRERVLNGEDFGELAKHFSDGSTGKQGGELGKFERGMLAKSIEDQVFKLNRKEMTPVIKAQNGFMIIQVEERYEAGVQPLEKVENQVIGKIASKQAEPKLREYLDTLRKDSFVEVHAGYTDTAGVAGESISEINTAAMDPTTTKAASKPKKHKRFLLF
jgi:peptidyl-prolyl cis-trans isomerase SurA